MAVRKRMRSTRFNCQSEAGIGEIHPTEINVAESDREGSECSHKQASAGERRCFDFANAYYEKRPSARHALTRRGRGRRFRREWRGLESGRNCALLIAAWLLGECRGAPEIPAVRDLVRRFN